MRLLLALHLCAAVLWVGGMAFAVLVLRPSLAPLEPAQRLVVMEGVLTRFLPLVGAAIVVLVGSGIGLLTPYGGLRAAPAGVHAMIGIGVVMIVVYAYIVLALQPRLRANVRSGEWRLAGAAAERMRKLIVANLVLGVLALVAAAAAHFA
jgi:uncharacterized membrane protein